MESEIREFKYPLTSDNRIHMSLSDEFRLQKVTHESGM